VLRDILVSGDAVRQVQIWDGTRAWLVTRYADARAVLSDDNFSADPYRPNFPEKSAAYKATVGQDRNLRTLDNPEHDRQKRMVIRDFTVKRVEAIRPAIQDTVDGLIDDMLAGGASADIVTDLAFPVPTQVICELLGVPYTDRDYFGERSNTCLSREASAEEAAAAGNDLYDYLDELVDRKLREPADDMVSRLAVEQAQNGTLTRSQVVEMARIMLVAGHETTANMIALSTLTLLRHPGQAAEIRESTQPSLIQNAVDELLRYLSVAHTGRRRIAVRDVEIGGQLIRAGEGVIVANNVADRDETMFPDAHELNIHRRNARATLAFGYGIHQCIGQLLSRVELQVVHGTLWRRIPTLRLAVPFDEVRFKDDGSVYGLHALPVTWDQP
jgi:hypothetical protein